MRVKSKYKIARRLGAAVFEKTQTQKFALRSEQRRGKRGFRRSQSVYAKQLLEKQKVRYTYNVSEKQFSKYVKEAIKKGGTAPAEYLFTLLEKRLDNVILKAGFAPTRFASRQCTSHGHFTINKTKVTIPSYELKEGDVIEIREGSKNKGIFENLDDSISETSIPNWIKVNNTSKEITIKGQPIYTPSELSFNLDQVLQFYKR